MALIIDLFCIDIVLDFLGKIYLNEVINYIEISLGVYMNIVSLKNNKDFRKGYSHGKSFVCSCLVTYIIPNNKGITRVGITTSKKVGNAVKRNRARRIIKESFRLVGFVLPSGYDFIFVARVRTTKVKMCTVRDAMINHMSSYGIHDVKKNNSN